MTAPVIPPTFDNPRDAKAQAKAKAEKEYRKAQRPIYQKKRFILPVGFVVLFLLIGIVGSLGGAGSDKANTPTPQAVVPAVSTAPATAAPTPTVDQAQVARDKAAAAAQVKADAAKAEAAVAKSIKVAEAKAKADAANAKAKADAAKRAEAVRLKNLPTTAQEQAIESAQSYLDMVGSHEPVLFSS